MKQRGTESISLIIILIGIAILVLAVLVIASAGKGKGPLILIFLTGLSLIEVGLVTILIVRRKSNAEKERAKHQPKHPSDD